MSQREKVDPFEMWRDFLNRSEQQLNTVLTELTTSPQFSKAQGRVMETILFLQRNLNETTQRYLSTLNLPTRGDVLGIAERLTALEERLGNIEDLLRATGSPRARGSEVPRPRRTRQPPSASPPSEQTTVGQKRVNEKSPRRAPPKARAKKATTSKAAKTSATKKKVAPRRGRRSP